MRLSGSGYGEAVVDPLPEPVEHSGSGGECLHIMIGISGRGEHETADADHLCLA
jgi:hypothetical protein